jgi:uncharacterized protein
VTRLNVAGLLREPVGATRTVDVAAERWSAPDPVGGKPLAGTLVLQRTNRGILLKGEVRTMARRTCIRCLDEFDEPASVVLAEEFLPSVDLGAGVRVTHDAADEDITRLDARHELDLLPILTDEFALAEPMHPLCRPDCPGLCPECGRRRDSGACGHETTEVDPRLAALADWRPPPD